MRDLGFEPAETGEYYFLSYNSEDAKRIAPLFKALSDSGVHIWYDKGINYNTTQWDYEIASHIKYCKAFLFAQTNALIQKENSYAKREYQVAQSFKKEIFILAFDQVDIRSAPRENTFFVQELTSKQKIQISGNLAGDAEEICRILKVEYKKTAKVLPKDSPKNHKILLPAIAAACAAALIALFFIIRPVPPFPADPTPAPTAAPTEEPTPIPDPWMCKWCGSMNGYENSLCWKCKMPKDTTPTPTPTDTPEPPTPTPSTTPLSVKVGDHLTFGHYPQTSSVTDNTPIEWRVLDVQDGKALVISEYGLDAKPYNTKWVGITWKDCTLRKWLNGEFLKKAFRAAEQGAILTTKVDNSKKQHYGIWSTCKDYADTEDKIFLLSYAEANKYFDVTYKNEDNVESRVEPTAYAIAQGASTSSSNKTSSGKDAGYWWLRSPGYRSSIASGVDLDGSSCFNCHVCDAGGVVRPALWLDLNAADGMDITITEAPPTPLSVNVGDHLTFGHYPQTEEGTDNTPIEWRVLDVQDGKALVISEYGLDAKTYNTKRPEVTWETCTLRAWLNGEFLNAAFSAAEQGAILTTTVDNSRSQHYSEYSKTYKDYADTQDKIFLLSYAEANRYFGVRYYKESGATDNIDSRVEPTAYAIAQGADTYNGDKTSSGKAAGLWWLRSPGVYSYHASIVDSDGFLHSCSADYAREVVWPALWLNLNAAGGLDIAIAEATPTPTPTPTSPTIAPISSSLQAGDHITFGHYPQTAEGTDSTPIEWRVLDVQGDKALVISEYGLDAQPYNEEYVDVTWESCTLRTWLNGEFLNAAFSSAEQGAILTTTVDNSKSQHYSEWRTCKDYADTEDKIFLLSYAEANKYFDVTYKNKNNVESRVEPTAYAIAQGASTSSSNKTSSGKAAGWWFLRSPGLYGYNASVVYAGGSLDSYSVYSTRGAVRPALWLDLNAADGMDITITEATSTPTPTPTPPTIAPISSSLQAGDHITFGHYPQTAEGTDSTPIEWRVLDVQGDKALVISEYGLDAKPYNTKCVDITWRDCTLRTWLNNDFLNKAFSASEQGAILTTKVDNSKSQHYDWTQTWRAKDSTTYTDYADTEDKIFLLSYAEANRYFDVTYESDNNVGSRVEPTAYAIAQGAWTNSDYKTSSGKAAGYWWLRSPGSRSSDASDVRTDGSLDDFNVSFTNLAVRPALWLNLNSVLQ